jgi:phosphohistidine phosphatase
VPDAPVDSDFERYPTAATAVVDFDIAAWSDVVWGAGQLTDFAIPRTLE